MTEPGNQVATGLSPEGERYLICVVLGEYYAFPARFIGEIALFDKVYPLPLLPDYILGIINRYSSPYVLLDTGLLLSGRPCDRAKILVLNERSGEPDSKEPDAAKPGSPEPGLSGPADSVAFLIDDVLDIVEIASSEALPVEDGADELIVSSFLWKGKNVLVLDVRGIISRAAGEVAA
jgi:purine-binding chemotaxis protein CheW